MKLRLLGAEQASAVRGKVKFKRRKSKALLALLALSPGGQLSRERLCGLLWPDQAEASARAALRQSIKEVRDIAAGTVWQGFHADDSQLTLDLSLVETDIDALWRPHADRELQFDAACAFRESDLLQDIEWVSEPVSLWVRETRAQFRNLQLAILQDVMEVPGAGKSEARRAAECLLSLDATHEPACRYMMQWEAAAGNVSAALRIYERLWDRLEQEFDVEPSLATQKLAISIKLKISASEHVAAPAQAFHPLSVAEARPLAHSLGMAFAANRFAFATDFAKPRAGPRLLMLPAPASAQSEARQIAEGLLEDVAHALCRFRSFGVVAPYTMRQVPEDAVGRQQYIDALRIDYLVTSRVTGARGGPRVTCALVDARSQMMVWSDEFGLDNTQHADLLRIARRIAQALAAVIDREERRIALASQNMNAYWHCLLGQAELEQVTLGSVTRATKHFSAALNEDRTYAPAWSGLARAHTLEWLTRGQQDRTLLNDALRHGQQAVAADPDDARGLRELGFTSLFLRDHDSSLGYYEQARVLNPHHSDLLMDYGDALSHAGDSAAGIDVMQLAYDLNPLCADYWVWSVASIQYQLRQYSEAVRTTRLMRDDTSAWKLLAASLAQMGEKELAQAYSAKVKALYPEFSVDGWTQMVPNRRREETDHYADGLRKAGFT